MDHSTVMIMDEDCLRRVARALADPKRVEIIHMVSEAGELCCGEIVKRLGVAQPTVSHHIKELVVAGILIMREDKQYNFFSVSQETFRAYVQSIEIKFVQTP